MNKKKALHAISFSLVLLLVTALASYAGEPTDQVKQSVEEVLDILRNKELKRPEKTKERRAAIRKVVDERFDFEEMAKRSLGLYWKKRTPEERKEFSSLYSDLLERAYIRKIEAYTGEKVVYTGENVDDGYSTVRTRIITKKNIDIPIDYKLHRKDGKWEVYDVIIEGVSLVNNYRTQFYSIISSGSFEELMRKLKRKESAAEFKGPG
ncbi:MAG: ABC transporter substrate-binding protein [Nitrospirae bacterium]|nr:ABC transporter substrate-binding protein [Nitrospirota bacterium]